MAPTTVELARISLFESLGEPELAELASAFETRSVMADTRLTGEGAIGYSFFALADGEATVAVGDSEVATLAPGDCFGEIALLDSGLRTATVTTTTPARLYVMFGSEFRRLQERHPEIAARLEELMRKRIGA